MVARAAKAVRKWHESSEQKPRPATDYAWVMSTNKSHPEGQGHEGAEPVTLPDLEIPPLTDTPIGRAVGSAAAWIGPGIEGVAEGQRADGSPCVVVLTSDPIGRDGEVPAIHGGFPVEVRAVGLIRAEDLDQPNGFTADDATVDR